MSKQWIAFLLKDKHSSDQDKQNLKKQIINCFNRKQDEVCYISTNSNVGLAYYFFVKEYDCDNDMRNILQSNRDAFQSYDQHTRISQQQLLQMIRDITQCKRGYIKFGDLVKIQSGIYNNLYGIVLRQNRNNKLDVGIKFCFGSIIQSYDANDLNVIGNIFNYIKVLN